MTTTDADIRPHLPTPSTPAASRRQLRQLLTVDAAICLVSGAVLVVAATPVADLVGLSTSEPVRVVGIFLVLLGGALAWLSNSSDKARQQWVPINAAGDLLWAAASLAVAVLADLTGPGRALIAAQGLLALSIGETKLVLLRRAQSRD
jgi:hypothetical protein